MLRVPGPEAVDWAETGDARKNRKAISANVEPVRRLGESPDVARAPRTRGPDIRNMLAGGRREWKKCLRERPG